MNTKQTNNRREISFNTALKLHLESADEYKHPDSEWIYQLGVLLNKIGMNTKDAQADTISYLYRMGVPQEKETLFLVIPTIWQAYKNNLPEYNTWGKSEDHVYNTPYLPDSVFYDAPRLLRPITELSENKRERDVMFLSSLTVLSSCFPNFWGIYDNKTYSANLFLFISAPASAGKGCLANIRRIGDEIQKSLDKKYLDELNEYQKKLKEYNENKESSDFGSAPIKPVRKILFIPANNTSAKLIDSMKRNGTFGIVSDTEADTLTQALKSQHGNFSDIFRKAFHNETIELQRKLNDEHISIPRSYLSLLLSGTPAQIENLMDNVENGLVSRFMYYDFSATISWKNVFEKRDLLPETVFKHMSIELNEYTEKMKSFSFNPDLDKGIIFKLKPSHETKFNTWFSDKQEQLVDLYGLDIVGNVRRLGLVTFRIAMILSIVRKMETEDSFDEIVCDDRDFSISLSITDCLLFHTTKIFSQLTSKQKQNRKSTTAKPIDTYFDKLPDEFTWQTALDIASYLGIKDKTAGSYIGKYIQVEMLIRVDRGNYRKI